METLTGASHHGLGVSISRSKVVPAISKNTNPPARAVGDLASEVIVR